MRSFDAVVIGAGPAGEVAAGRMAEGGLKVAIVEEHLVGGECSFYACMPSKALLRPAEVLEEVKRIPGAKEALSGGVDAQATLDRRDEIIHDLDDSVQLPWLESRDITLIRGRGRLSGERRVIVDGEEIEATKAVMLATGSGTLLPPIPGLKEAEPWGNREITTTKENPGRLLILGGGVVGVEMAQAWSSLGAQVTLVEGASRLIPREETFACEQVTEALTERGVAIKTGRKATEAGRRNGSVTLTLDDGETVEGDRILVCVGRKPLSEDLGIEQFGLPAGRTIDVDEHCRVPGLDWLYVVGDLNGRALLTHMGKYQGRLAGDHVLGKETAIANPADGPASPRVIFTDPQVGAVGLTSDLAAERGINVRTVDVGTSANAGGSFYGRNAAGTARLVIDQDRGVIVGATITGAETADMIHAATIAIVGEVPLERLWHAVPCFPTRSELWLRLLETYGL